jgi:hypothetical protein
MNDREMSRLAQDPAEVRRLAKALAKRPHEHITEYRDFLDFLATYKGEPLLTTRQRELLEFLRSSTVEWTHIGPHRISSLIQKAWERRLDLNDEEGEEWLEALYAQRASRLDDGGARRLAALCRRPEVDLLAHGEWHEFSREN